jgi:Fe-Mn family superoxide dismutase
LLAEIVNEFGTFEAFKTIFATAAAGVQGSGWAWLGFNPVAKRLEIIALPNQDPLTSKLCV